MADLEVSWEFVKSLAELAGEMIRNTFDDPSKAVESKYSAVDLVTQVDSAVENALKSKISAAFPQHKFICEETANTCEQLSDSPTWIIDPIDGTTNFVHSFPMCCVSIAFARNMELIIGCVYAPITNEMFYATKGGGAFLNGKPIRVSSKKVLSEALVAMGFGVSTVHKLWDQSISEATRTHIESFKACTLSNLEMLLHSCRDIRHIGSCALELAFVACGRLDALFLLTPHIWDYAAGTLIVREAGGQVVDVDCDSPVEPQNRRLLAVATSELREEFRGKIKY